MSFEEWERNHEKGRKMKKILNIIGYFLIFSLFVFIMYMILEALDTPEVEFSWSTKQCKQVVYMNGEITDCSILPKKYDLVWVE